MRALLPLVAACSFDHVLLPQTPHVTTAQGIAISLDHVKASALGNQVEVAVTVTSPDHPVAFDGLRARLHIDAADRPASADSNMTGGGTKERVVASIVNALYSDYLTSIARCTARPSCTANVRFETEPGQIDAADLSLDVADAVGVALPPLALASRREPANAWRAKRELRAMAAAHIGGGVVRQARGVGTEPSYALEIGGGYEYGPVGLAAVLSFGNPLMIGADLRYAFERGGYAIVPFAGYGWYEMVLDDYGDHGTPQGHGARVGIELDGRSAESILGATTHDFAVGGYLLASDAWMQAGQTRTISAGLTVAFY